MKRKHSACEENGQSHENELMKEKRDGTKEETNRIREQVRAEKVGEKENQMGETPPAKVSEPLITISQCPECVGRACIAAGLVLCLPNDHCQCLPSLFNGAHVAKSEGDSRA